MANLTNGTLDTRLAQNLVKEFNIPANKEYDKLNPFKIGGGNAIWITHIPPNIKVWFSTDQNFDNAQRLDYMNRGMRYLKIGEQGITRLYDNFFIFTEGVVEDDYIKICVSTQGEDVEPILSSNTNQIDQVDSVGYIKNIKNIQNIQNTQNIRQLFYVPPIAEIAIKGEIDDLPLVNNEVYRIFITPLGYNNSIKKLNLANNKYYRIKVLGHIDIGTRNDYSEYSSNIEYKANSHFLLFNNNNNAVWTDISDISTLSFDNIYKVDKRVYKEAKNDYFDLFGIKYSLAQYSGGAAGWNYSRVLQDYGINNYQDIIIRGDIINNYENFGLSLNFLYRVSKILPAFHSSMLLQIYEVETL